MKRDGANIGKDAQSGSSSPRARLSEGARLEWPNSSWADSSRVRLAYDVAFMKVFISWSGDLSRQIAEAIRDWLPGVIQAVRPYFTPDDVAKGSRWNSDISKELSDSSVGLICLTADNLTAPWIMFEAGALAKNLEKSKVCPLLFGLEPTDIKGPLVQFQATEFKRDDFFRVIKTVNGELRDSCLAPEVLESVFDMWWPKLKESIDGLLVAKGKDTSAVKRSERDLLEELLALTRDIAREPARDRLHPGAIKDLLDHVEEISTKCIAAGAAETMKDSILALEKPTLYFAKRVSPAAADAGRERFEKVKDALEAAINDIPF